MTRRTLQTLLPIVAAASITLVLVGCESTETGNPERMQKSLDSQRKAMGTPGQGVPPMPTGPGMPTAGKPGTPGEGNKTAPGSGVAN